MPKPTGKDRDSSHGDRTAPRNVVLTHPPAPQPLLRPWRAGRLGRRRGRPDGRDGGPANPGASTRREGAVPGAIAPFQRPARDFAAALAERGEGGVRIFGIRIRGIFGIRVFGDRIHIAKYHRFAMVTVWPVSPASSFPAFRIMSPSGAIGGWRFFPSRPTMRSTAISSPSGCRGIGVVCWAYCLMPNHVHFILAPPEGEASTAAAAISRSVGEAHRRYTAFVNARARVTGHLFQGRFGCVAMDEAHVLTALRYLAFNPVRARLSRTPEAWPWSSVRAISKAAATRWRAARPWNSRRASAISWNCRPRTRRARRFRDPERQRPPARRRRLSREDRATARPPPAPKSGRGERQREEKLFGISEFVSCPRNAVMP